ncbi:nucleotidyl transferase AbiEii/AbiGii toxin family protein [Aequorivita marisscotiae]|uniref:Nucleotidyl transferase AbiEii/AbiGii toxin family protein n=1 Tax=Aequorivita marisscotiae TaxID=3040348 RepID=A0ABY8KRA6_9FLAO|nr:nucleotidyl transferase AbiEii/AbiGii toxin family protein [Aequorivita sp. Ant34-E75]WGF91547.1 nucleotidyl transferase AbiEii/AbiGii toxin family protein [Aequorivita sp. Ant34-E75]
MLHYNTVSNLLRNCLLQLMTAKEFNSFRLVGGTSLSLQIGHRESVDIDLFSDVPYGTIDFEEITAYLQAHFPYVDHLDIAPAIGKSYFIGKNENNAVKLDVYHTDTFIEPLLLIDTIRLASVPEIIAMKIDVVQRGGRKKDFWDLHALFDNYTIEQMLALHKQRHPYTHDATLILQNFIDFSQADDDFDPICLLGKYWEFIKDDIVTNIEAFRNTKNGFD